MSTRFQRPFPVTSEKEHNSPLTVLRSNGNKRFDTGNYLQKRDPERVILPLAMQHPRLSSTSFDTGYYGHYQGHWLSATAFLVNSTGNATVKAIASSAIDTLATVMAAWKVKYGVDGYLFPYAVLCPSARHGRRVMRIVPPSVAPVQKSHLPCPAAREQPYVPEHHPGARAVGMTPWCGISCSLAVGQSRESSMFQCGPAQWRAHIRHGPVLHSSTSEEYSPDWDGGHTRCVL